MIPKQGKATGAINSVADRFVNTVTPHIESGLLSGGVKKEPSLSTLGPGPVRPIKKNEGEADILAKMYRFMVVENKFRKQEQSELKKQHNLENKIKERQTEELATALGGEYKPEDTDGKTSGVKPIPWQYIGTRVLLASLFFSPDAMAKVQELIGTIENSGIAEQFKTLSDKLSGFLSFGSSASYGPIGPTAYDQLFKKYEEEYGIPPGLLKSIAKAESGFNPNVVSQKGAAGLMQLMPATASMLGVKDVFNPEQNVMGGAKYVSKLMKMFNGNIENVVAAYNAGEGTVKRYGGPPPFRETQDYTKKVIAYFKSGAYSTPNIESTGPMPDVSELRVKGGTGGQAFSGGTTHSGVVNLAKKIQSTKMPGGFNQFTAFNDEFHEHANPSSMHNKGLALDYTINDKSKSSDAEQLTKQLLSNSGLVEGKDFIVEDEYKHPSGHATGGHIHVEFKSTQAASIFSDFLNKPQLATQTQVPPKSVPMAEEEQESPFQYTIVKGGDTNIFASAFTMESPKSNGSDDRLSGFTYQRGRR